MTASEGRIDVPGGRAWYRIVGEGPGRPLLLLHGGPGAGSAAFEPLAALGSERPVIFYDQLGAGRADRPDDVSLWRSERFVDEVTAVRRALALDDLHLLGHSWGGFLALECALELPAGLRTLSLCSAAASSAEYAREARRLVAALPPEVRDVMRRHEEAGTTADAEYFEAMLAYLRRHVCRLDPWPAVMLDLNPMEMPAYQEMWGPNEFTCTGNLQTWNRVDRLGEIAVPTLVTCGRHDEATPTCAETLRRGIRGAELHVFEESAHMTFLEQPEEFVEVVGGFLRRHD